jgi:hypothetical protein
MIPWCIVVDTTFDIWLQEQLSPQKILPPIHHGGSVIRRNKKKNSIFYDMNRSSKAKTQHRIRQKACSCHLLHDV